MFVYAHWMKDGHQQLQAFNKPDAAATYAYNQIAAYISQEERHYAGPSVLAPSREARDMPPELTAVKTMLEELKEKRTLEQVQKLIELYEEFCRHVVGQESPLHAIQDIPVVE